MIKKIMSIILTFIILGMCSVRAIAATVSELQDQKVN